MQNLPDDYNRAITNIVRHFADFELALLIAIANMTRMNIDVLICLVGSESLEALFGKYEKLILTFMKDKPRIASTVKRQGVQVRKINALRNKYVHSAYEMKKNSVLRVKFKRRFSDDSIVEFGDVSLAELERVSNEIEQCQFEVVAFFRQHQEELHARLDVRPED